MSILRVTRMKKVKRLIQQTQIVQITWTCGVCGEKGAGSVAKDRHNDRHNERRAIAQTSNWRTGQLSIREREQMHSREVLARLSLEWARKQKEAEEAKKNFHQYMKDKKSDW